MLGTGIRDRFGATHSSSVIFDIKQQQSGGDIIVVGTRYNNTYGAVGGGPPATLGQARAIASGQALSKDGSQGVVNKSSGSDAEINDALSKSKYCKYCKK